MLPWILLLCAALAWPAGRAVDDAAAFVGFVEEQTATCVARNGVQIAVRNTHTMHR
jgi:hypothetical protein